MRTMVALLKCTSVRFSGYYFLAYYCGLEAAHATTAPLVALGALFWVVPCVTTEALNRIADRGEDEINRPERTRLCHQVGFTRLRAVAYGSYVLMLLLEVVWFAARPSLALAVTLVLGAFVTYSYSLGPRLCRRRLLAIVALGCPFALTFAMGWALGSGQRADVGVDFARSALPVLAIGTLALGTLTGAKDLTDVVGDERVQYSSGWVAFVGAAAPWLLATVVSLPFIAIIVSVAAGGTPQRFLWLMAFAPLAFLQVDLARKGGGPRQLLAFRELFYTYWLGFLMCLAIVIAPGPQSAVVVAATALFWWAASRWLHWYEGASSGWLRLVIAAWLGHHAHGRRPAVSPGDPPL